MRRVLHDFNSGDLDAAAAAGDLGVSRARLYELRAGYLRKRCHFEPKASGGDRRGPWPEAALALLCEMLPLMDPPNFQLLADELHRLCGWRRSRPRVEAHVKAHMAGLVPSRPRRPRVYRRFRRAHAGELWQHDSSVHQWWPAACKQVLLLTLDDHSGMNLGGCFAEADTTWAHFRHFRGLIETHGLPEAVYTDALSLFGESSMSGDHADPKSQFQRAFKALGVAHLVAPTPQAKGKIERRFGTFQRRMVTLLAHAKVRDFKAADQILQMEIERQNRTRQRSTGRIPLHVWRDQIESSQARLRPAPQPSLLDLHLSLRCSRRVNNDHSIDFEGKNYEIAPTARKTVTIILHPKKRFWVVEHAPTTLWPPILGAFTL